MKTKVFLLALFIMNVFQMSAQNKDEVTLVVSASGTTTEEATKAALRSAIEQAYGAFVSANTTILNDELVKDEIVTVSNGNIKNYKEIANTTLADGRISVTLQAMVSISKLVSYAQSKGASTEFAGAAFAMNMKMKELNKKNEMAALENLLVQVKQMLPYAFNRELVIGTPKEVPSFETHQVRASLKAAAISCGANNAAKKSDIEEIVKEGGKPVKDVYDFLNNTSNYYEMPMEIHFKMNENTIPLFRLIVNTLESLSLTKEEQNEMREQNIKYGECRVNFEFSGKGDPTYHFSLRNYEDIENWCVRLRAAFLNELFGFIMTDNLGGKSYFTNDYMLSYIAQAAKDGDRVDKPKIRLYSDDYNYYYITNGIGLFSPLVFFRLKPERPIGHYKYLFDKDCYSEKRFEGGYHWELFLFVHIPKDKIMEYSNFSLERKSN